MVKTIHGVQYNTDCATLVGFYDNFGEGAISYKDMAYWGAGLYITPLSKRFFLAGNGGKLTRFALKGEGVIPLTRAEAYDFTKRFLGDDAIRAYFTE